MTPSRRVRGRRSGWPLALPLTVAVGLLAASPVLGQGVPAASAVPAPAAPEKLPVEKPPVGGITVPVEVPPVAVAPVSGPVAPGSAAPGPAAPGQAPPPDAASPAPAGGGASPLSALPPLPPQENRARLFDDMPVAVLGGLDKVTARVSTFEVPVGQEGHFGRLTIAVRTCRKAPPIEEPEAAAFLQITQVRPDDPPGATPVPVFSGWMFASSPALSAMEDPVYDVWVVDCKSAAAKTR